jgi:hypothetical protein
MVVETIKAGKSIYRRKEKVSSIASPAVFGVTLNEQGHVQEVGELSVCGDGCFNRGLRGFRAGISAGRSVAPIKLHLAIANCKSIKTLPTQSLNGRASQQTASRKSIQRPGDAPLEDDGKLGVNNVADGVGEDSKSRHHRDCRGIPVTLEFLPKLHRRRLQCPRRCVHAR